MLIIMEELKKLWLDHIDPKLNYQSDSANALNFYSYSFQCEAARVLWFFPALWLTQEVDGRGALVSMYAYSIS